MDLEAFLREQFANLNAELYELKHRISKLEKPEDRLKNEVITKFNRNKKNIIKQKIMDLMGKLEIAEIKDIIVDQQKYCSKATFYRYVEDIKKIELKSEYYI